MSDLQRVFQANERVARFRAEHEAATAKLQVKHEALLQALSNIKEKTDKLSLIEGSLISRLRMIAVQAVDNDKL